MIFAKTPDGDQSWPQPDEIPTVKGSPRHKVIRFGTTRKAPTEDEVTCGVFGAGMGRCHEMSWVAVVNGKAFFVASQVPQKDQQKLIS